MRQVIDRRTTIQKLRACMSKLEQASTEHACTLFLRIVFFPVRGGPNYCTHTPRNWCASAARARPSMRPSGSMSSRRSIENMPPQQIRARGSMSSRSSIELPRQQLPSEPRPPQAKRTSIEVLYSAPRSWRRSKASVKAQLDIEIARRLDAELQARLAAEIEMALLFAKDEERESDLETLRTSIQKRNTLKLQATGEASRSSTNKPGRYPTTEADEINRLIRASAADGFGNVLRERRKHRASLGDNSFWTTFFLGARTALFMGDVSV